MAKKTVSFEEKLKQLSEITEQLETGSMSLDEMLGSYEKGIKLFRECHQILENAESKINLITLENQVSKEEPFTEGNDA